MLVTQNLSQLHRIDKFGNMACLDIASMLITVTLTFVEASSVGHSANTAHEALKLYVHTAMVTT